MATVEAGHPNDGLKILQAGQVASWGIADRDQRAELEACAVMDSATALAMLGEHQQAYRCVASARQLWTPGPQSRYGDMDRGPARLEIKRGRLEVAEQFVTPHHPRPARTRHHRVGGGSLSAPPRRTSGAQCLGLGDKRVGAGWVLGCYGACQYGSGGCS